MRAIELLFPRKCVMCDTVLPQMVFEKDEGAIGYLCDDCKKKYSPIKEPLCKKCGRALRQEEKEYCSECTVRIREFSSGRAMFTYEGDMKKVMYRFKYSNMKWYAEFFEKVCVENLSGWIKDMDFDLVIPVPLHRKKYKKRGYNQADIIGRRIAERLDITYSDSVVERSAETAPQKFLGFEERKNNLKNAFNIRNDSVLLDCEKVLIVDDIFTTGATVDSIAELLKTDRDREIFFLCVCIGGDD